VEYLDQLVSSEGVSAYPYKVNAMNSWTKPKNLKQLRDFFRTHTYRHFIANYATISSPLTELFKKDNFVRSEKANNAFELLKHTMIVTQMLRLHDFTIQFVVATDAFNVGVGVETDAFNVVIRGVQIRLYELRS
jgi:hypothetical protein